MKKYKKLPIRDVYLIDIVPSSKIKYFMPSHKGSFYDGPEPLKRLRINRKTDHIPQWAQGCVWFDLRPVFSAEKQV